MARIFAREERQRPHHRPTWAHQPLSSQEIDIALQHAQQEADFPDPSFNDGMPFHPGPPGGMNFQPHMPFQGHHRFDHMASYDYELSVQELVRRTNLAASLANGVISPRAQYMQVYPMMCADGKFPADFRMPKTLQSIRLLDTTQLDRILQEYKLPFETRTLLASLPSSARHALGTLGSSSARFRQAKLHILFEHLGAIRIVDGNRGSGR
ncbi:hypothetical protein FQN50_003453 [Emmonsiellopsis sp. PD_5]|nr:hypothetical protein FQN50_003453 [Emmonsiellopsis sp. PD_5]